jgi:hypothetical protein
MKALFIPADPSRSVELIEINRRDDTRSRVGGLPEPTRYDRDSILFVSDTGRIDGHPMNLRATNYIRVESDAGWERGGQLTDDPTYGLYGNVVAVGGSGDGLRDVPDRLVERFARSREVSRGDKIHDAFRDHNEDGMIRFPWLKDRSKSHESPFPNWTAEKVDGRTVYYGTQGEAVVWKDHGSWMMDFAVDPQASAVEYGLRPAPGSKPAHPPGCQPAQARDNRPVRLCCRRPMFRCHQSQVAVKNPRCQLAHPKIAQNRKDLMIKPIAVLLERGDRAVLLRQVPKPHFRKGTDTGLRGDLGIPFTL